MKGKIFKVSTWTFYLDLVLRAVPFQKLQGCLTPSEILCWVGLENMHLTAPNLLKEIALYTYSVRFNLDLYKSDL